MTNFKDNSGLEEFKPKSSQAERDEQMKKFLEKGGKVEKLKPGYPINVGSFERNNKPAFSKEDIEKGITGKAPMPNYNTYKKVHITILTLVGTIDLYGSDLIKTNHQQKIEL